MKKTIGLLTFQNTTNYGSMLQAFALYYCIKNYEPSCELINYHCPTIEERELPLSLKKCTSLKKFIKWILCYRFSRLKYNKFQNFFYTHFENISKEYTASNIEDTANKYQTFIVGSDIIWGLDITGGDYTYFFDFLKSKSISRYAYAASFGHEDLPFPVKDQEKMSRYIGNFNGISVRESSGVKIVKQLTVQTAEFVLDPTLLLDRNQWRKLLHFHTPIKKRYILVYFAYNAKKTFDLVKKLAKKEHCKILYIHNSTLNYPGVINIKSASIEEFLNLIYNAAYIVSGSYHGVVFSVNFNKQFFYINEKYTARITSFIELLEIKNRSLSIEHIEKLHPIDYKSVNEKVNTLRKHSLHILSRYAKNEF